MTTICDLFFKYIILTICPLYIKCIRFHQPGLHIAQQMEKIALDASTGSLDADNQNEVEKLLGTFVTDFNAQRLFHEMGSVNGDKDWKL